MDDVVRRTTRFMNEDGPIIAGAVQVRFAQACVKFQAIKAKAEQAGQAALRFPATLVAGLSTDAGVPLTRSNLHDSASILAAIEARRRVLEAELAALPALRASLGVSQ